VYDGSEYRGFGQSIVEELAQYAGVPVWNGLTNPVDDSGERISINHL